MVTSRMDTGPPYPIVRPAGTLDSHRVAEIRSALLDLLITQPEAVLVDVSGLHVTDPAALVPLQDLVRETTDWPAARLILCAADPEPWQTLGLPIVRTVADGLAELGDPGPERRCTLDLGPVVGAARRSRELLTDACLQWDRPDLASSGCIVVTEMVNNVVSHAHTEMTVLLALRDDDALSVAVRDHSPAAPHFAGMPAPTSYGGRGLLLIDSVASRWGNLALDDGKVVWALVPGQLDRAGMAGQSRG